MNRIDEFLNSFTMYKTVLFGLLLLAACSFIASFFGAVDYSYYSLLISLAILIPACYISNLAFSKVFKAPANTESYFITAIILFFVLTPPALTIKGIIPLFIASIIAMASKYIFAIKRKHLFNPVAIAAVLISFLGIGGPNWWIATPALTPAVLIIGILVVRKLRKFSMFLTFIGVVFVEMIIFGLMYNTNPISTINQLVFSWPVFFFATIMLTEPLTMPPTRSLQVLYAGLVGFLFAFQMSLGPILLTPELSLIVGNVFSYIVSSKQKIMLHLERKDKLSSTIYNYVFQPSERLLFSAGQYVEWTLPHKNADIRGNRRYFTIASSPTEESIMLGVRITDDGSSFKKALLDFKKDDVVTVGSLKGDFLLPDDKEQKLVFLAGGIGITPFRSIIKYLLDKNDKRDIVLFHSCSRSDDFVYKDVFNEAKDNLDLKVVQILADDADAPQDYKGERGHINKENIEKYVPDYKERLFYISGSNMMVDGCKKSLEDLGIPQTKIVTDYFSGY